LRFRRFVDFFAALPPPPLPPLMPLPFAYDCYHHYAMLIR